MTQDEKDEICGYLDQWDGELMSVLVPYQKVKHITDKKFQDLRMDYLDARTKLLRYIGYN